ncbi:hypothetical protein K450DRAFT_256125 [Umbelopsis ramanniana AG]|uniref:ATP-dependent DNA helicase II subunit 2 n=1 Tax=Umbelopsis ramanniana AG TaxID=1314678 RepID=A0AAD5E5C7_UMBRA|nr:uncharacterized protein K450DRAFT_256125 [Umbelopsis ramanniana AG]KAI8576665.1 hypothetical protein K450DRAFT_256125 [Umbelopsis ramanniana AG]
MAHKVATTYIIDVSPSMEVKQEGVDITCFQQSINAVAGLIQDKLLVGRKTDMISIILAGTEGTDNSLVPKNSEEPSAYEHITTIQRIDVPDNELVRKLLNTTASKHSLTDVLSALILAENDMDNHCGKLKYVKKIILFTDAESETDWSDIGHIQERLAAHKTELIVIIAGYTESDTSNFSETKADNIKHFRTLAEADYVDIIPMKDAVDMLSTFKVKTVNPTPVFRGELLLGDAAAHPLESLSVPVFMYARTYEAKLPTAKKWSALSDTHAGEQALTHDVGKEVSYKIKGSNKQANGATEQGNINSYDLEHAYPFGKSLVVITAEDEKFMKIETKAGMFILGFLSASSIPRDYLMSNVYVILPRPADNMVASATISSLARALYEQNAYALVRYVAKENQQPKLGVLVPYFEPNIDALHFIRVPFAEDIRQFPFAPLDVVTLPNGKEVTDHKLLPSKELEDAMDAFVASMELPKEPDGSASFSPEKIFNPAVWRLNEAIKQRSLNKAAPIPELHSALKMQMEPLPIMMDVARDKITKLTETAGVKKVNAKEGKKRRYGKGVQSEEPIAPIQDIVRNEEESLKKYKVKQVEDADMELDERPGSIMNNLSNVREVGAIDPIKDFRAMIDKEGDFIEEAVQQMSDRIEQLVKESFADQYFEKAKECLQELREQCKKFEEGVQYNDLCRRLKVLCDPSNPQSQRLDFWKLMIKDNITLLSKDESADVDVSQEEQAQFLTDIRTQPTQKTEEADVPMEEKEDELSADNLLDMLE